MSSSNNPILTVEALSAVFPNGNGGLQALDRLSFSVDARQFVCVLGPSGSGKSTLLRILAGLLKPTAGEVALSGVPVRAPHPGVGLVFQQPNLMPWRPVIENITLPLELRGVQPAEARARARALVELVGLAGFENWLPRQLSGGMAQRVALARALIHDPTLLLLDEPFGALDALTREQMSLLLLELWQARRQTVIMVTHDVDEAVLLADRVLVFTPRPGRLCLEVMIDLARPRGELLRYAPAFVEYSRRIRQVIRDAAPAGILPTA